MALASVEAAGIRIDTAYLERAIRRTARQIARAQADLESSPVIRTWRKTYRNRTNLNSTEQLGHVLFHVLEHPYPEELTATGKYKTDEKTLGSVDHPFVQTYLQVKKLRKVKSTYLEGLQKHVVDGYVHPFFNLHLVKTFRSSSDSPNFQNLPVRNPEMGRLVRRAFVSRPGRRLVEVDYGGIEVRIAACYHEDPRMLSYIEDTSKDMHRDMAMECYMLPRDEVTKAIRYCGKNMFVFPQFYGSYWVDCSHALWTACEQLNLTTASGVSVREHLRRQGFTELGDQQRSGSPREGTYEAYVQKVERRFWEKRFPVYARWKREWYDEYQDRGWFVTKTGFVCQGQMKRNEVINYPVQGSAFHCLLQSLVWLVDVELRRRRMETLIVGQIHDSILADVPEGEVDDFLALCQRVMVHKLRRRWDWIITPLEIEAEATPPEGSWADKQGMEIPK